MKKLLIVIIFFLLTPFLAYGFLKAVENNNSPTLSFEDNKNTTTPSLNTTSTTSTTAVTTSTPSTSTPYNPPLTTKPPATSTNTSNVNTSTGKIVNLPVPFYWEIPDGVWVAPWSGACEEASIVAAESYYLKKPELIVKKEEAKATMFPLFGIETKLFGYNIDTDAKETAKIINDYSSFDANIKWNPTLDEIKEELDAGRPVITMHYGYGLENPRHRFRQGGSSYHVMVLTGYDDSKKEFFVNDSELNDGIDLRYKYDIILSTLHDFDHKTKKANGTPVALFTKEKRIVKSTEANLYLLRNGIKYPISNESVMKAHRWDTSLIQSISEEELGNYELGDPIDE